MALIFYFSGIVVDSRLLLGVSRLRYLFVNMDCWIVLLWDQLFHYGRHESSSQICANIS